jgi:hypothetical protein
MRRSTPGGPAERRNERPIRLIDSDADGQVVATRIGLRLSGTLSYDNWQRTGSQISKLADLSSWCLGDWLAYGECQYTSRYRRAVEIVGLNYQTLRNYAWVARRFDLSRRRDNLSFQHHMEVAKLPPAEQDRWLDLAAEHRWTTSELRRQVREREAAADGNSRAVGTLLPRIKADRERITRWRDAAEQANMDFLSWMTTTLDLAASNALGEVVEAG